MYGTRVDHNSPGEVFGFTYSAHGEWRLTATQPGLPPPVVWVAGAVPAAKGMNVHLLSSKYHGRQEGPGVFWFRISQEAQYTRRPVAGPGEDGAVPDAAPGQGTGGTEGGTGRQ